MYKVLIVDDEKPIVDGLKVFIDWEELGFKVVGSALNGNDGVKLAKELNPDVIITDIRMPLLDGIEMIERIKVFNQSCRFMILSGYSDFEYAREALRKGAFCYILKPVNESELVSNLNIIKEELDREENKKKEEQKLKRQLYESLPALRERYLNNMVKGRITDEKDIIRHWALLDIGRFPEKFCIAVVEIDDMLIKFEKDSEDMALTKLSVANITEEVTGDMLKAGNVFNCDEDRLAIILYESDIFILDENSIHSLSNRLRFLIENSIKETVTIGVGNIYDNPSGLQKSFAEAEQALKYKLLFGKNSHISIGNIKTTDESFDFPVDLETKLFSSIERGNREDSLMIIDKIFDYMLKSQACRPEFLHQVCFDILAFVSRHAFVNGINYVEMVEKGYFLPRNIFNKKTAGELKQYICDFIAEIIDESNNMRNRKLMGVLGQVKEYIQRNYHENITLDSLAEKFYINPSYLSQLFRKECGYTFLEFLTITRLEKAKTLLLDPALKVYEVSDKVGYSNPRYFSRVFEKYVGCTPAEYRKNRI